MDRDCKYHPGKNKEKVFAHRCSKGGCKKREMLQVACAQCYGNFCIQHRHPLDHSCRHASRPTSNAGCSSMRALELEPSGAVNALSSWWLTRQFRWKAKR
ncbi:AN1-type zinc finger protein 2A isoform X3 [Carlito syrichta]|nr:AN1-type zinc finger protein 2A isoform X3 [Carlito syrichta]